MWVNLVFGEIKKYKKPAIIPNRGLTCKSLSSGNFFFFKNRCYFLNTGIGLGRVDAGKAKDVFIFFHG